MRISSALTPLDVAPPLLPENGPAQGAEYSDSIWRGGLPTPWGQARGVNTVAGTGGAVVGVVGAGVFVAPGPVGASAATPLLARCSDEMMADCLLSGGALGDSSAV